MQDIIKRLKSEKAAYESECREIGRKWGVDWAKHIHYAMLKHMVTTTADAIRECADENGSINCRLLEEHDILKLTLESMYETYPDMNADVNDEGNILISDFAFEAVMGFLEGVESFWDEVKNKL